MAGDDEAQGLAPGECSGQHTTKALGCGSPAPSGCVRVSVLAGGRALLCSPILAALRAGVPGHDRAGEKGTRAQLTEALAHLTKMPRVARFQQPEETGDMGLEVAEEQPEQEEKGPLPLPRYQVPRRHAPPEFLDKNQRLVGFHLRAQSKWSLLLVTTTNALVIGALLRCGEAHGGGGVPVVDEGAVRREVAGAPSRGALGHDWRVGRGRLQLGAAPPRRIRPSLWAEVTEILLPFHALYLRSCLPPPPPPKSFSTGSDG